MVRETNRQDGLGALVYVGIAIAVFGSGLFWYLTKSGAKAAPMELSAEAKQYVRNLKLSDVNIKATESYVRQTIVEIEGKITNTGTRAVDTVEVFCVFYDPYGLVVLRQRVPVVSERNGGLKPGQTKSFRLPFDSISENWNKQLPQLVIAGIKFGS